LITRLIIGRSGHIWPNRCKSWSSRSRHLTHRPYRSWLVERWVYVRHPWQIFLLLGHILLLSRGSSHVVVWVHHVYLGRRVVHSLTILLHLKPWIRLWLLNLLHTHWVIKCCIRRGLGHSLAAASWGLLLWHGWRRWRQLWGRHLPDWSGVLRHVGSDGSGLLGPRRSVLLLDWHLWGGCRSWLSHRGPVFS
jgi:hypothetical protein